jgi:hypothetical protein
LVRFTDSICKNMKWDIRNVTSHGAVVRFTDSACKNVQ